MIKCKVSALRWNEEFKLPDGSYFVLDIQGYLENIIKKHQKLTVDPAIKVYVNNREYEITFRIKTEYYIKLLTPETVKWWKCPLFRNYWSNDSQF